MSNATVSFLGKANNTGDDNALFLKVFSGEVLASLQRQKQNDASNYGENNFSRQKCTIPCYRQNNRSLSHPR